MNSESEIGAKMAPEAEGVSEQSSEINWQTIDPEVNDYAGFYSKYRGHVIRWVTQHKDMLKNSGYDILDVVQQVFTAVLESQALKKYDFKNQGGVPRVLKTIAMNFMRDLYWRNKRNPTVSPDDVSKKLYEEGLADKNPNPEEKLLMAAESEAYKKEKKNQRLWMEQQIETLEGRSRKIGNLYFIRGKNTTEIALELGLKKPDVMSVVSRIKQWLKVRASGKNTKLSL